MKVRLPNGIELSDVTEEFALRLLQIPQETKAEPENNDRVEDFATTDELEQAENKPKYVKKYLGKKGRYHGMSIEKLEAIAELVMNRKVEFLKQAFKLAGVNSYGGLEYRTAKKYLRKKYGFIIPKHIKKLSTLWSDNTPKKWKTNQDRMTWIHTKIKSLRKALPNLSYEEYFHRASQEYDFRKHMTKKEQPERAASSPFKILENAQMNEILNQILRKIVQTHGTFTWQADSWAVGIDDYEAWKDLISKLFMRGEEISRSFEGHGSFHLEQHENRASLHYY